MDAFGFERILIETVGVGQSELDVAKTADSTVVVLVPESGDSIQAMKAGLMEAADLFVINKSDRPGADRIAKEIQLMLHLRLGQALRNVPAHHGVNVKIKKKPDPALAPASVEWQVPVLQTIAETGAGVPELAETLDRHWVWLQDSGELAQRRRLRLAERVREVVERRLQDLVWREGAGERVLQDALTALQDGSETPYTVAARIVQSMARQDWE
jgi:LAO/AO transport system kinase